MTAWQQLRLLGTVRRLHAVLAPETNFDENTTDATSRRAAAAVHNCICTPPSRTSRPRIRPSSGGHASLFPGARLCYRTIYVQQLALVAVVRVVQPALAILPDQSVCVKPTDRFKAMETANLNALAVSWENLHEDSHGDSKAETTAGTIATNSDAPFTTTASPTDPRYLAAGT
ncbi:uncharacterized protein RHO25_002729 [Cercospora beticola]|uniref:Uncharacterized protein n=1 Tax=Cercospora beticola TaxID=122368 RepID=A0ABZ0NF23_CERBT|nr:hypothetical protein RHO25_002729 [Cercospora beticola]